MMPKRKVIAVIDDNLAILSALGRLLSALGFDTELYTSSTEFLDSAMTSEASCLIIDIQLGETSGFDLAEQLANAGFVFPIIFMSAHVDESVETRAREFGCIALLAKPFTADALLKTLVDFS